MQVNSLLGIGDENGNVPTYASYLRSNVFTNVTPGPHDVNVWHVKTGEFSCDELVISGVSIIDYPNFFIPNGDGFHDTWNRSKENFSCEKPCLLN